MIKNSWYFYFFIIVATKSVFADDGNDLAILNALPKYSVRDAVNGKIDNNTYVAALVSPPQDVYDIGLVILEKTNSLDFKLVSKTKFWMLHERHIWNISIKKNSIFLSLEGSGGCCSRYYLTYQFKNISDKFKLVGVETRDRGFISRGKSNEEILYENGKSINFLTKKVKTWRNQGISVAKTGVDPYLIGKITKKSENNSNFIQLYNLDIDNFDYWDFGDYMMETKGIKGYFDDKFKYNQ